MPLPWEEYAAPQGIGPDPYKVEDQQIQRDAARRAADAADRANRNSADANGRAGEAQRLARERFIAELYAKGLQPGPNGQPVPIPGWKPITSEATAPKLTAKERADAIQAYNDAFALDRVVQQLSATGKGPLSTKGAAGIQDFLPNAENKQFNKAAQRARGYVKRSLGFTGGEGNTLGESTMLYDPYLPESGNYDSDILDKIESLKSLANDARTKSIAILGGVPDANGRVTPVDEQQDPLALAAGSPTAPPAAGGATGGGGGGGTLPGGPQGGSGGDGLTFEDGTFVNFSQIDARGGMEALRAKHGEPRLNVDVTDDSPLDPARVAARDTFGGAVDTTMRNVANMATFGFADKAAAKLGEVFGQGSYEKLLAEQQYQNKVDAEANPFAAFAGDVGGALLGTGGIAKAGRGLFGKSAPRLLGGGRAAQFGRNLGTDATFGGGTAAAQGQDVGTGALMATLGSGLGQGAASAIGRAAMPIAAPVAKKLSDSGITLSLGQIMRDRGGVLGRMIGGIEDRMAGFPVVGDLIEGVRTRGVEDYNKLDMNDALTAIGGRVDAPGMAGFAQADQALSDAYTASLNPMRLQADAPFNQALGAAPQYADDLVRPFMGQNGEIAGEGLQAAKQAIQGEIAANRGVPGGFGNVRTLQDLNAALLGMAQRQAPDLAQGYKNADTAFEALYPIRTSVAAAGNKQGVYTPAQKGMQLRATDKSSGKRQFALGNRSGQDLQRAAQELLPSRVPDSGTAGRLIVGGIGLGAGGAGSTGLIDPNIALPIAAIASLYTKTGQKAVAKALLSDRPKAIRSIGAKIRKRKGLFGSAAIPLMMQPTTVN